MPSIRIMVALWNIGILLVCSFPFLINGKRYRVTNLEEVNDVNRMFVSTDVENVVQCARKCHATNCTSFTYGETLVAGKSDCYDTTSSSYTRRQSRTISGEICQRWDALTPHSHSYNFSHFPDISVTDAQNFCRDPDNESAHWCYTMNPDVRWQFCPVTLCGHEFKNERCYKDGLTSKDYNGTWNLTQSGKVCQRWDAQSPNSHSYTSTSGFPDDSISTAENYCRDPSNSGYTWCYTVEPGTAWEACDVTSCTKYLNDMKCYDTDSYLQYTGKWDMTIKDVPCQRWDSQTPHGHSLDDPEIFPDDTIADAANYCRDPDDSGYLWCYTIDPGLRWMSCGITKYTFDFCSISSPNEVTFYDGPSTKSYMGTWNKTKSGKVFQRWDNQQPHPHTLTEDMFNEESLKDVENFCRDPTDTGEMWCYTTDPGTPKEKCGIGKYSGENTCQTYLDEVTNGGSGQSKYYTRDP